MELIKAILVDFDGTFVNSERSNAAAYSSALKEFDISCPVANVLSTINGRHWSHFLPEIIGSSYTQELGQKVANRKKELYRDYYHDVAINKGVVRLLQTLPNSVKKGIVSNASKDSVHEILDFHKLRNIFDILICGEDVRKSKPDPESYVLAMKTLDVLPSDCLALEDSDAGIAAAIDAGIEVVKIEFIK